MLCRHDPTCKQNPMTIARALVSACQFSERFGKRKVSIWHLWHIWHIGAVRAVTAPRFAPRPFWCVTCVTCVRSTVHRLHRVDLAAVSRVAEVRPLPPWPPRLRQPWEPRPWRSCRLHWNGRPSDMVSRSKDSTACQQCDNVHVKVSHSVQKVKSSWFHL